MTKKKAVTTYALKAQTRADILWQFYNTHGRMTIKNIKALAGIADIGWLKRSFAKHGLELPPIYDSQVEMRERYAAALREAATDLDRDWITSTEAAKAAGKPVGEIWRLDNALRKNGLPIPKIIYSRAFKKTDPQQRHPQKEAQSSRPHLYSDGLQVLSARELPDGQVVYLLR